MKLPRIKEIFSQYETREVRNAYAFLVPILVIVVLFILVPVIGTVVTSLQRDNSMTEVKFIGLTNFIALFSKPDFWTALKVTLAFTFAAIFFETLLGMLFALLLNEPLKGRGFLRAVILIPWAIPTIISARTWQLIYDYTYGALNWLVKSVGLSPGNVNWLGTDFSAFWAIVASDVWKTTPFMVIILLAGLQAIPQDLYKQATIDGAGMWKRFWSITLPLVWPVLVISLIFRTIDSVRVFDLVYVLTGGGPGGSTKTLSFLGFESFANGDFGMGSAVSVFTFLLAFAITVLYIRFGKFSQSLK